MYISPFFQITYILGDIKNKFPMDTKINWCEVRNKMRLKDKELNLKNNRYNVESKDVLGGEALKKLIFESQRQMARTLLEKSTREDHNLSKNLETRMLIAEASRKAAKILRTEDLKVRLATTTH